MRELTNEVEYNLDELLWNEAVYDLQIHIMENIDPEDALPIIVNIQELQAKWGVDFVRFVESINLVFGVE